MKFSFNRDLGRILPSYECTHVADSLEPTQPSKKVPPCLSNRPKCKDRKSVWVCNVCLLRLEARTYSDKQGCVGIVDPPEGVV